MKQSQSIHLLLLRLSNQVEQKKNGCDDDLIDDNVFQSADENDEQELSVANKKNLDLLKVPRSSTRERKRPIRYPENISNNTYANYCRVDTPYTFEKAMSSNDIQSWVKAMDKEIESLNENKTWELVERIPNKKVLDVNWVYSKKSDDTYKARLIERGFQQTNVIDDRYAPVAKMQFLTFLNKNIFAGIFLPFITFFYNLFFQTNFQKLVIFIRKRIKIKENLKKCIKL